eukprot:TRINITY_DN1130_c0_g1_i1.p1 TRINITY_DN1130_c0_g1~~TRINITY_DN1130_c0_g1_i1.p1  ORF type:complete len:201 (-),score=50.08 TRINITY_DN1130_c0_g1_i1:66-668(-)
MKSAVVICALLCYFVCVNSLTFKLDAHKEECFYEDIEKPGVKVLLQFQVSSGGFLDIDVNIYNPDNNVIHSVTRESEGRFTFTSDKKGTYRFCFGNMMSTVTPKTVSFNIVAGDSLDPSLAKLENLDPIERSIVRLSEGLNAIQNEQKYLRMRERTHRDTSESTNSRVLWWSIFEAFVLVGMSVLQVFFLKRFFEVKRAV